MGGHGEGRWHKAKEFIRHDPFNLFNPLFWVSEGLGIRNKRRVVSQLHAQAAHLEHDSVFKRLRREAGFLGYDEKGVFRGKAMYDIAMAVQEIYEVERAVKVAGKDVKLGEAVNEKLKEKGVKPLSKAESDIYSQMAGDYQKLHSIWEQLIKQYTLYGQMDAEHRERYEKGLAQFNAELAHLKAEMARHQGLSLRARAMYDVINDLTRGRRATLTG